MKVELPLIGVSSPDENVQWLRNERINWFPESAPSDSRTRVKLMTPGGLTRVLSFGTGFVRGMHATVESVFVVAGETLWECTYDAVTQDWTKRNRGGIAGSGRVDMDDGFIPDTSRYVVIGSGDRGYVYDSIDGLSEITNNNFETNSTKLTPRVVAGYTVWDTPNGMMWSEIDTPTTYPALNKRTAETVTDGVLGLVKAYGDIWMVGQESIEVTRLSGEANENAFTLAQTIDYGGISPYGHTNADNRIFFLEAGKRVYVAQGWNCTKVSSPQIDQWLSSVDCSEAFMFSFVDRGHEFVALTVPGSQTQCYDVMSGIWSRRKSKDMTRWRVNAHALYQGFNLFGDYNLGRLRKLDINFVAEGNGEPFGLDEFEIVRELYTPFIHDEGDPVSITSLELFAQMGHATLNGEVVETDPIIEMRYADHENEWSNWESLSVGKVGEYATRLRWNRLGQTYARLFHIRISDPVRCDLMGATVRGGAGWQA